MSLSEELARLKDRVSRGELSEGEFAREKDHLLEDYVGRIDRAWNRSNIGNICKPTPVCVHGLVRSISPPDSNGKRIFDLDGVQIELGPAEDSAKISLGERVIAAGFAGVPIRGVVFQNETTGTGTTEAVRKMSRNLLIAAMIGAAAGPAIIVAGVTAWNCAPPVLSTAGAFHTAVDLAAVVAGATVAYISFAIVVLGLHLRHLCALVAR